MRPPRADETDMENRRFLALSVLPILPRYFFLSCLCVCCLVCLAFCLCVSQVPICLAFFFALSVRVVLSVLLFL